jgi:hypothetical protein
VKRRVPASEGTRKRIEDLISGESGKTERSDLVKLAAQLIIEDALEGEVQGVLGREHYARGGDVVGHRNGYRRGKLDTAEGRIEYAVPQVRGIAGWRSAVREALSGRSEELERLAIEMYARGLSVRDIEAAFVDDAGRCVLSKSAVSMVTERLWTDYQAFASRDLSEHDVARYEGGYGLVQGVSAGPKVAGAHRSGARRHRRRSWIDPRGGGSVSAQLAAAVSGAPNQEP